jgi:dephospho-CoA kinase
MTKKIIVVTGLPGSGKSEVSGEIKKNRIPTFISGNIIKEEVAKRGLDLTLESEEFVARELRKQYGPDAPIKLLEHKITDSKASILCVDGPRNIQEVQLLETFGEVYLIIVESTKRLRYQRLRKRGGPRDPEGWKHFMWRDRKELERGMKSLIKTKRFRKYIIKNTGTLPKLKSQVSRILKDVKSHKTGKT